MHANYLAALEQITVLGAGGEVARVGPWLLLDAGEDFDYFNIAALTEPAREVNLSVALSWFAAREKPFRFIFRDDADVAHLRSAGAMGFIEGESEPAMVLSPLPTPVTPPSPVRIRRATTPEEADVYAAVEPEDIANVEIRRLISRRALALPGCPLFTAYLDEQPVARSMGLRTGTMAGVYNVYVRPEARRRGLGEALTSAALEEARVAGASAGCLSSSPQGYRTYLRMGFEPLFRYISMWRPE